MKIVQINATYGNADSTGRNVKEMHEWLKKNSYCSIVYAAEFNEVAPNDPDVHVFSNRIDRKIHGALSRLTGLQGYFSSYSTHKLIKHLAVDKPDAIILHVLHNNSINFPILCRYLAEYDIPTILVLHDCWYFTGHCCHYTQVKCLKWKQDCCECAQIHEWNKSWFFDTAQKCLFDKKKWFLTIPRLGIIGVSDWITSEVKQSILKSAKVIQRVYNWIDLDTFKPQDTAVLRKELGIEKEKTIMLGVASNWSDDKGLQEIILTAKEMPNSTIVLVGNTPKNIIFPKNIICTGTVYDPKQLAQYYAMADVLLNPSVQETFGKTTAEAMACGTPVVAYETTACTELVSELRGKLVKLKDKKEYVHAVQEVLKNKNFYTQNCVLFGEESFAKNECIKQYINVVKTLNGMEGHA